MTMVGTISGKRGCRISAANANRFHGPSVAAGVEPMTGPSWLEKPRRDSAW